MEGMGDDDDWLRDADEADDDAEGWDGADAQGAEEAGTGQVSAVQPGSQPPESTDSPAPCRWANVRDAIVEVRGKTTSWVHQHIKCVRARLRALLLGLTQRQTPEPKAQMWCRWKTTSRG